MDAASRKSAQALAVLPMRSRAIREPQHGAEARIEILNRVEALARLSDLALLEELGALLIEGFGSGLVGRARLSGERRGERERERERGDSGPHLRASPQFSGIGSAILPGFFVVLSK